MIKRLVYAALITAAATTPAAAAIDLGSAAQFAVLAGSAITNTGASTIVGNVGVAPSGALTGLAAGTVTGSVHSDDPVAIAAQADLAAAYDAVAAAPGAVLLSGQDLGGLTLTPGVYRFATSAQLTGTLTLDGRGDPNAEFLFQIGTTLISAANAAVVVLGGGGGQHVFYQVGTSATIGADTQFTGNLLALTSITLGSGVDITGRVLAHNGAVTLIDDAITLPPVPLASPPVTAIPEPGSWLLLLAGFGVVGIAQRRARSSALRVA